MKFRKLLFMLAAISLAILSLTDIHSQTKPTSNNFTATQEESKDLVIAKLKFDNAGKDAQLAMAEWNGACEALRVAKKWPTGTRCDITSFQIVPPPEVKKDKPKPAEEIQKPKEAPSDATNK